MPAGGSARLIWIGPVSGVVLPPTGGVLTPTVEVSAWIGARVGRARVWTGTSRVPDIVSVKLQKQSNWAYLPSW